MFECEQKVSTCTILTRDDGTTIASPMSSVVALAHHGSRRLLRALQTGVTAMGVTVTTQTPGDGKTFPQKVHSHNDHTNLVYSDTHSLMTL